MNHDENRHVSREELIASIVDEAGLGPRARDHLRTCPVCRGQRERITEGLEGLKREARRLSPEPSRTVVLPAREEAVRPAWTQRWVPALSFAAGLALVILILSSGYFTGLPDRAPRGGVAVQMDDGRLMAEVSMLEENPLPEVYDEISPEEAGAAVDDDTLDFVVPIDEESGLS